MITGSVRQVPGRRRSAAGVGAISAVLVFHAGFRLTVAHGESTLPTLKPGDPLVVKKTASSRILRLERSHSCGSRTVFPNTVNSATPGVIPFGQPVMTNRARVPTVGVHSR